MPFEPITTQEQYDKAVEASVKQAREEAVKPYADYETLKKGVADRDTQLAAAATSAAASKKTIDELQAKVKGYEIAAIRDRVAHEVGLPYGLGFRLTGEDEASIRKDAEGLLASIKTLGGPPPAASGEPTGVDAKSAALKALLGKLTKE